MSAGADHVFEVLDRIDIAICGRHSGRRRAVQHNRNAIGASDIAIVQRIGTRATIENIVAETACYDIGEAVARDRVGIVRADDIFDIPDRIDIA